MLDITVIILTKDEKMHIERCIDNIRDFVKKIYVVDSFSKDGTQGIATASGAEVHEHTWPGNQATQFNWALDNLPITTEWILRLDADEYLTTELKKELEDYLPEAPKDVSALVFPLGRAFMGRLLRHGIVNGVSMIRMFRKGAARYENRIMDEHLLINQGVTHTCKNKFIDDNRMPLDYFITKHNGYAIREATIMLQSEISSSISENVIDKYAPEVIKKRGQKIAYAKLPLFLRPFGYFIYRYFFKLGFLDGKEGFMWDFFQGWWYRTLVDAKVYEIKRRCGDDPARIRHLLETEYGVRF